MSKATKPDMIATWMGRDIRELGRDELIEALNHAAKETQAAWDHCRRTERMHSLFNDARARRNG